ncbi:MAG: hypothetical protein LBL48_06830 [Azoarcus sp.]|nr:hypothetical protein [Azoarcus sp.]
MPEIEATRRLARRALLDWAIRDFSSDDLRVLTVIAVAFSAVPPGSLLAQLRNEDLAHPLPPASQSGIPA